jgi:hypothetical protein
MDISAREINSASKLNLLKCRGSQGSMNSMGPSEARQSQTEILAVNNDQQCLDLRLEKLEKYIYQMEPKLIEMTPT